MKKRLFISTGEVSGDLQGALLIKALYQQAHVQGITLEIIALGGDRMAAAGATLIGNTTAIGSIGVWEALRFVGPTLTVQRQAKQVLRQSPPDVVVLIDYMGPNIAMGTFASQSLQVPVVYYIAPQEWVWSSSLRSTRQVVAMTQQLLAVFPEEARYYASQAKELGFSTQVTWVGHPLVDRMKDAPDRDTARQKLGIPPEQVAIALMPASRWQELKYLMPVMFKAAQQIQAQLPQAHFWIPLSLEAYRQPLEQAIQDHQLPATIVADSHLALAAADLAITKSGTVNLEIALLNVPQVVLYRVSRVTAWIGSRLLRFSIPFMSPTNLAIMKPVVPEFLQDQATPEAIAEASLNLLLNPAQRQEMLDGYQEVRSALGNGGAVERAAQEIIQQLIATSNPKA